MHSPALQLTGAILGLALSGCSTPGPPPAPPSPVSAPVSFDGGYSGTIQITSKAPEVSHGWCDTPARFSVSVRNNAFTYVLAHPNISPDFVDTFQVTIDPDGSFGAQTANSDTSMTGQITQTRMTGQINGEACGYAFTAQRLGD